MNELQQQNALLNMGMNDSINASTINTMHTGWYNSWPDVHYHWWPSTTVYATKNTFEQAFKVVSKLIENGTIKEIKLKDFIKLVKEVEEIL